MINIFVGVVLIAGGVMFLLFDLGYTTLGIKDPSHTKLLKSIGGKWSPLLSVLVIIFGVLYLLGLRG